MKKKVLTILLVGAVFAIFSGTVFADGYQALVTGWRSEAHTYQCYKKHQTVVKRASHRGWAGWSGYGYFNGHSQALVWGGSGSTAGGHSHARLK